MFLSRLMISRSSKQKKDEFRPAVLRFFALLFLISVNLPLTQAWDGGTPAETIIVNRASATYQDENGNDYESVSKTVTVTVVAVPAVSVTPDETSPSDLIIPNLRVTRVFRICNSGNTPDTFLPTDARITTPAAVQNVLFDEDESGTISPGDTPVVIGQTFTRELATGACVGVLFDIQTGNLAPQSQVIIGLTARSSRVTPGTKGYPQDVGTIINTVGEGVILTAPADASLPPVKLVENVARYVAAPGQTLNYKIQFRNRGSVDARQVRVIDDLPDQLTYVANTLRLNNRTLTDASDSDEGTAAASRIELLIPRLIVDSVTTIEFQARLTAAAPNGEGVINFADLSAINAPEVRSSDAVVVVNPVGIVYAGNSAGSVRIPGAILTLAGNEEGTAVPLNPKFGFDVNPANSNPYSSNGNGEFSFGLGADQIGSPNSPARYVILARAQNYRSRLIELLIEPETGSNGFFNTRIRALDGQAIAVANGFQLTEQTVRIDDLAALVFNIPMFDLSTLEISKSADKNNAQIGDIVSYRLSVRNATASPLENVMVYDTLPPSFGFVSGTGLLERGGISEEIEPVVNGNDLTFGLGSLAAGTSVSISYRVRVGADAPEGTSYNTAYARGVQLNGAEVETSRVRAGVRITGGLFSNRQMIIGRVFEDRNTNGKFDSGDRPVEGARIYSDSGQSVITDSRGLYNFPAADSGSIVISLDPVTLPDGYMLLNDRNRRSSDSWTRLLRTPLGGGALLRQNFAIAPKDDSLAFPDVNEKVIARGTFVPPAQSAEKPGAPKKETPESSDDAKPVEIAKMNKPASYSVAVKDSTAYAPTKNEEIIPPRLKRSGTDISDDAETAARKERPQVSPAGDESTEPSVKKVEKSSSANSEDTTVTPNSDAEVPKTREKAQKSDSAKNLIQDKSVQSQELGKTNPSPRNSITPRSNPTETFTVETVENVNPVAPGVVRIITPESDSLVFAPALSVVASVANKWKIEVNVNGEKISQTNIGETRVDNRNQVTTYTFVGINLRPGLNSIYLTAIGEEEERGETVTLTVFGRGPAERIELVPDKNSISSDGREALPIQIRAFDRLGNPAIDSQIAVGTSAGKFYVSVKTDDKSSETPQYPQQQSVSMENGRGRVFLLGENSVDMARVKAVLGNLEAAVDIRFTASLRPTLLVGVGEISIGNSAPEIINSREDTSLRARMGFFYQGRVLGENLLTLAYNSQKPLNRVAGRDRLGRLDPLDYSYPIFGDSSKFMEGASSNSKIYARFDHGLSYAMFGDMEADMNQSVLSGYSRRLTGVKIHLENSRGDFLSVSGARPDTAFARDIFPGGNLSVIRLSHGDILPGSEIAIIEIRDRRNPEIVIDRNSLIRSVDYNIDSQTGEIFFLRPISTFDHGLNLIQVVFTYEYYGSGAPNYVYTARGVRSFRKLGLKIGASYVNQQQGEIGAFQLGGIDAEKALWNGGNLFVEAAVSRGRFAAGVNVFDFYNSDSGFTAGEGGRLHDGAAISVKLDQPLPFWNSRIRFDFASVGSGFYNPFGATVTAGAQRYGLNFEVKPRSGRNLMLGFLSERNKTENVDNSRETLSFSWTEQWTGKMRTVLGFDHREYTDNTGDTSTGSNLVTAGIEYRPTDRLELSVKREQNLTEADPTYPDQTTFSIKYKLNSNAKLFVTQRLAASAITPIGDFSGNGFAAVGSRNETAFGIETKVSRLGTLSGRYQIENGVNGFENFAVIGLQNSWKISKELSLETGLERGFLVSGSSKSFNSATIGGAWTPDEGFRANARYELRDRNGLGQMFAVGAVGKIGDNWTTSARAQWAFSNIKNRGGSSSAMTAAATYRPVESDKYALLFSYNRRSSNQSGAVRNDIRQPGTRDISDRISADGLYQVNKGLELYGRFALNFNGNGNSTTAFASSMTYLMQARAQQLLSKSVDVAVESRWLVQPVSNSFTRSVGTEVGYWVIPDLRIGVGYNFTQSGRQGQQPIPSGGNSKKGFYVTITTKLSNLFDLFGTSKKGLVEQRDELLPEGGRDIANNNRKQN